MTTSLLNNICVTYTISLNKVGIYTPMSSDDYQVQNIYRYSRKTYKKNRRGTHDDAGPLDHNYDGAEASPRSDIRSDGRMDSNIDSPGCSCDVDPESEIANILHKKCPVITLAQQQLQRLLDETDKLLCDNTRCCRSLYDFLCICKEICVTQDKLRLFLILLVAIGFIMGLIVGGATCGSYLGRFNSPILRCIDTYFISDSYNNIEDTYRSIV
ncbi:uncharacterized protein LOC113508298 [Trichoplusia ni]|uniref:Uncharacterized protein LOC113508298 n=1 Tax=Trichoplusia ni TaxID=7111 RepID=A0A7E5X3T1_TRINI|nr:uncharacterized protein LOC113508298 [Trichoplusia ni]